MAPVRRDRLLRECADRRPDERLVRRAARVVTRREHPAALIGQYGWDGGLGTIWRNDKH
jgi:hypothetical protein